MTEKEFLGQHWHVHRMPVSKLGLVPAACICLSALGAWSVALALASATLFTTQIPEDCQTHNVSCHVRFAPQGLPLLCE